MLYIASDHAGFELKEKLKIFLTKLGYEIEDMGAYSYNGQDDYSDFILPLARKVAGSSAADNSDSENFGIVIGGSGQGEAMAANRIKGARAVVYYGSSGEKSGIGKKGERIIRLSREHNNANILALGSRFLSEEEAREAVKLWLETPFSNESRHKRRIAKLD